MSVATDGSQGNGESYFLSISTDGRYVAFASAATNLVPGDTNGFYDVFVHGRRDGTTERVSVDSAGLQGNADSGTNVTSISRDGRYVAFVSAATNLVPGDTNGVHDVFVHDRQSGTTERVSVNSAGVQGNAHSGNPFFFSFSLAISADGRYVAFQSRATNLDPGGAGIGFDDLVFVRDRRNGTTELVSVGMSGAPADRHCDYPSISADGRFVGFHSRATNLVPGDTNGFYDSFVRDRLIGTTERVSVATSGTQGNGNSAFASISGDGRYVAFSSAASNLVPGDTRGFYGLSDVFVRDRQNGTTARVSITPGGTSPNHHSGSPWISADGRFVAFLSDATNLVSGDANSSGDVFVHDRRSGATQLVSVSSTGGQGDSNSYQPSISGDGRCVAFYSVASNLVAGDSNGFVDVFLHDREATDFTSLCDPGVARVNGCPCSNPPSGFGRGCDNSAATGGAILAATGIAYLSMDSLVFTTNGEWPTATSILLQGNAVSANGVVHGQGVRCAGGTLKRLYTKVASGGSITAPDFGAGDPSVSMRSATKGDSILPGQSRWYVVYYRDPVVLGGCPPSITFNVTQTGRIAWWP